MIARDLATKGHNLKDPSQKTSWKPPCLKGPLMYVCVFITKTVIHSGSFTYYVTQKNEILDPLPIVTNFSRIFFLCLTSYKISESRPSPSPLKSERNQ